MDKSELASLKELAKKARPGPWHIRDRDSLGQRMEDRRILESFSDKCQHFILVYEDKPYNNTAFIATATPQVVLDLIAEIERLEAENARWKIEAHDLDSSGAEMVKDYRQLEKQADWLAENCNAAQEIIKRYQEKIQRLGGEIFSDEVGKTLTCLEWRKIARKAVDNA